MIVGLLLIAVAVYCVVFHDTDVSSDSLYFSVDFDSVVTPPESKSCIDDSATYAGCVGQENPVNGEVVLEDNLEDEDLLADFDPVKQADEIFDKFAGNSK